MPTSEYKYQTQAEYLSAFRASHPEAKEVNDRKLYKQLANKYPGLHDAIAENHEASSLNNQNGLDEEMAAASVAEHSASFDRPDNWIGPNLERSLSSYENGKEYLSLQEANSKRRRGFVEGLTDFGKEDIWFAGDMVSAHNIMSNLSTLKKVQKGEKVDDEDLIELNRYMEESARIENATWTGMAGDIVRGSIKFVGEIGAIFAGLAFIGDGVASEGAMIGNKIAGGAAKKAAKEASEAAFAKLVKDKATTAATKEALPWAMRKQVERAGTKAFFKSSKKAAEDKATDYIMTMMGNKFSRKTARMGAKVAITSAEIGAKGTVLTALNPGMAQRSIAQKKMENYLVHGDENEKNAVLAGILDAWIENSSEMSGAAMGKVAGKILGKLPGYSAKKKAINELFGGYLMRINSGLTGDASLDAARRMLTGVGVDNILEEMAEERLGGFARGLLGVEGEAGLGNAIDKMIPDLKQMGAESLAFAIPGATFTAVSAGRIGKLAGGTGYRQYIENLNRLNSNVSEKAKDKEFIKTSMEIDENVSELVKQARVENASDLAQPLSKQNAKESIIQKTIREKTGWSMPQAGSIDALLKDEQFATVRQIVDYADHHELDAEAEVRSHLREVSRRNILETRSPESKNRRQDEIASGKLVRNRRRGMTGQERTVWSLDADEISYSSRQDAKLQKSFFHTGTIAEYNDLMNRGLMDVAVIDPKAYEPVRGETGYKVGVQFHRDLYGIKDWIEAENSYDAYQAMLSSADQTGTQWKLSLPYILHDTVKNFKAIDYAHHKIDPNEKIYHPIGASNVNGVITVNGNTRLIDAVEDFIEASVENYYGKDLEETDAYNELMFSIRDKINSTKEKGHEGWKRLAAYRDRSRELFVKLAISRKLGHAESDRDYFDLLELDAEQEALFDRLLSSAIPSKTLAKLSKIGGEFRSKDKIEGEKERLARIEDEMVEANIPTITKAYSAAELKALAKAEGLKTSGSKKALADRLIRTGKISLLTEKQADRIAADKARVKKVISQNKKKKAERVEKGVAEAKAVLESGENLIGRSFSLLTADVANGVIKLQFNWHDRLLNHKKRKLYENGTWDLNKILTEAGLPKDEKAMVLRYADGKHMDLDQLVEGFESEIIVPLTIKEFDVRTDAVDVPDDFGEVIDDDGPKNGYEYLSVNQGEGTYREYTITLPFNVPGEHGDFNVRNLAGWFRVREYNGGIEINEVQSELFQKNKEGFFPGEQTTINTVQRETVFNEGTDAEFIDFSDTQEETTTNYTQAQADFLNIMLKKDNWVKVFSDAIIAHAENSGFESIGFPTGETAQKAEGHTTIAEQIAKLTEQRKHIEAWKDPKIDPTTLTEQELNQFEAAYMIDGTHFSSFKERQLANMDKEIARYKAEGIEKLAPVAAFYENRVASAIREYNPELITDKNGNTWQEIELRTAEEIFVSSPYFSAPYEDESPAFSLQGKQSEVGDAIDTTKPSEPVDHANLVDGEAIADEDDGDGGAVENSSDGVAHADFEQKLAKYQPIYMEIEKQMMPGDGLRVFHAVARKSKRFENAVIGSEQGYIDYVNAPDRPTAIAENHFRRLLRDGIEGHDYGGIEGGPAIPQSYAKSIHTVFSPNIALKVVSITKEKHEEAGQTFSVSRIRNQNNRTIRFRSAIKQRRQQFIANQEQFLDDWIKQKADGGTQNENAHEFMAFFTLIPANLWDSGTRVKTRAIGMKTTFNMRMPAIEKAIRAGESEQAEKLINEMYAQITAPQNIDNELADRADIDKIVLMFGDEQATDLAYTSVTGKGRFAVRQPSQLTDSAEEMLRNPEINTNKKLTLPEFLNPYDGRDYTENRAWNKESADLSDDQLIEDQYFLFDDYDHKEPKPDTYQQMSPRLGSKGQVYLFRMKRYDTPEKQRAALKRYEARLQHIPMDLRPAYVSVSKLKAILNGTEGRGWAGNSEFMFTQAVNRLILEEALMGNLEQYRKPGASWSSAWYEMTKRASQTSTPGIRMKGNFRYMVINDSVNRESATDGDYWYSDRVAEEFEQHLGSAEMKGLSSLHSFKGHVSSVKNGKRVLIKGLGHKLSELAAMDSGYKQMNDWLMDYNRDHPEAPIDFIFPTSTAKYHDVPQGGVAENWYDAIDDARTGFNAEAMAANAFKTAEFDGKDMYMSQWLNYDQKPSYRRDSVQFESAISHFEGSEYASEYYNELLKQALENFDQWGFEPFYHGMADVYNEEFDYTDRQPVKKSRFISEAKEPELWDALVVQELDWRDPTYEARFTAAVFSTLNKLAERKTFRSDLQKIAPLSADLGQGIHLNEGQVVLPLLDHTARREDGALRPAIGGFASKQDAIDYVNQHSYRFRDLHHLYADGTFDMNAVEFDGARLSSLRDWEIEVHDKMGWVIPGELVMENRIPNDALHSGVPSRTYNVVNHVDVNWDTLDANRKAEEANWSMSDLMTARFKGEDNDGDSGKLSMLVYAEFEAPDGTTYMDIDLSSSKAGLINKAQLAMWSGYMDPTVVKHVRHEIDLSQMDALIDKNAYVPPVNSVAGWMHLQDIYSKGDEVLKIFARSSSVMDILSSHKVTPVVDVASDWMRIADVSHRDMHQRILLRNELGTFLTNLALDDVKSPRLHSLNIDQVTAGYIMPLVYANGTLRGTMVHDTIMVNGEEKKLSDNIITDYMRYAKQTVNWLQTSPIIKDLQEKGMKAVRAKIKNEQYEKEEIERFETANELSDNWMALSDFLAVPKNTPQSYEEYLKADGSKYILSGDTMLDASGLDTGVSSYVARNHEILDRRKAMARQGSYDAGYNVLAMTGEDPSVEEVEKFLIEEMTAGRELTPDALLEEAKAAPRNRFSGALEVRHEKKWSDPSAAHEGDPSGWVDDLSKPFISTSYLYRMKELPPAIIETVKREAEKLDDDTLINLALADQQQYGFGGSRWSGSIWDFLPSHTKAEINDMYIEQLETLRAENDYESKPITETDVSELTPPLDDEAADMLFSLQTLDETFENLLPFKYMGADGLHMQYLDAMRQLRAVMHNISLDMETLKIGVGAKQPVNSKTKYDKRTIHLGKLMLDAVSLYIESGMVTGVMKLDAQMYDRFGKPVEKVGGEEGNYETVGEVFAAYNANAAEKNLSFRAGEEVAVHIQQVYKKELATANENTQQRMGRDFIEDLGPFYVKHRWWGFFEGNIPRTFQEGKESRNRERVIAERSTAQGRRKVESYAYGLERGLIAESLNAADLVDAWARDVYMKRARRILLTSATAMREPSGLPAVIFIPSEDNPVDPKGKGNSAIDDQTHRIATAYLANYLGMPYNPKKDLTPQLRLYLAELKKQHPGEYQIINNSTMSTAGEIYTLKGTAYNTMQMLVGQNYQARWLKAIERFNAWSKYMAIGVPFTSLFHPAALMESGGAAEGLTAKNMLLPWNWKKTYDMFNEQYDLMRNNPALLDIHIQTGSMLNIDNPDFQMGIIEQDMNRLLETMRRKAREGGRLPQKGAAALEAYMEVHEKYQAWMWKKLLPVLKFHTAEQALREAVDSLEAQGVPVQETQMRRDISRYANKAFGGLEMDAMTWATPRARQMLHMFMFAPDWTLAAAQISGVTNMPVIKEWLRTQQSPLESSQMVRRYWPAMVGIVMLGLPNMLQASIWAATRIGGDPDDKPFTFLNEYDKKFHVDITPLVRHFGWVPGVGYEGGETGRRRAYLRWGKQAFEVYEGWMGNAGATLMNKTSMIFKTAFEQVTEMSVNGWELPFKDQGLAGAMMVDGSLLDSRAGYMVRKFMPFALLAAVEDQPIGFFAPASKGASKWRLTTDMAALLTAYSEDDTVQAMRVKGIEHKMEAVAPEIIDAAIRNGYDPTKVVSRAVASVRTKLYGDFFRAINSNNIAEAEKIAPKILRLNGRVKNVHKSMIDRMQAAGKPFTEEHSATIHRLLGPMAEL